MLVSRAAEPVWALVSGLPRGERERRLFMVLQAFIDDSGNDPNAHSFMLAGFVAPSQNWAAFSNDWQALLDRPPGAAYLKTAHAYALQEQFHMTKGWNRKLRDAFLMDAADIINDHAAERVAVWVKREHFDKHIKSLATPYGREPADDPYFLCAFHLILTVAVLHMVISKPQPCDFIFDEHGAIGESALGWWGAFKQFAAHGSLTDFTPFLGSPPTFRDEKAFKPLQAADFFAWHLNKWIFQNKTMIMPRPKPLARLDSMTCREEEISERRLIELRESLTETAKRFAQANPNVPVSTVRPRKRPRAKWYPSGV